MLDFQQNYTGTPYTMTAALLVAAFVMIPLILMAAGPVGYRSAAWAASASIVCVFLARSNWGRHSQLTIPSTLRPVTPISGPK